MPYTKFVKHGKKVDVYKNEGGKEVKAFTSNSPSKQAAHRTAAIRESKSLFDKGAEILRKKEKR